MKYLVLFVLVVGLLMALLLKKNSDDGAKIGWIMFASAVLSICIASAPATVALLQK